MDSITLLHNIQQLLAPADNFLRWLSLHTYSTFYLFIACLFYWSGCTRTGARLGCGVLTSTLIFGSIRQFINDPRPYWDHPGLFNGIHETAWGMPSGHSQNAATFWGLLAHSIQARWGWFLALLLIFSIALSRLYLGVHYPAQVAAGLTIGLIIAVFWIRIETKFIAFLIDRTLLQQLIIILLITSLPLLTTLFLREFADIGPGSGKVLPYKRLFFYSGLLNSAGISLLLAFTRTNITRSPPSIKLLIYRALPGGLTLWLLWPLRYSHPADWTENGELYLLFWLEGVFISCWACLLWPLLQQKLCTKLNGRLP